MNAEIATMTVAPTIMRTRMMTTRLTTFAICLLLPALAEAQFYLPMVPGGTSLLLADKTYIKVGETPVLYIESGRLYLYGSGSMIEVGDLIQRLVRLEKGRK